MKIVNGKCWFCEQTKDCAEQAREVDAGEGKAPVTMRFRICGMCADEVIAELVNDPELKEEILAEYSGRKKQ